MRFALLGLDPTALALVRAIEADKHDLVWFSEIAGEQENPPGRDSQGVDLPDEDKSCDQATAALRQQLGPVLISQGAKPAEHWETLLDPAAVDVVIVARGDEERRADQLRKLAQAGMSVVTAHPVLESMLVYYELDMIRRETGCMLTPYLPARMHPGVLKMAALFQAESGEIGAVEQVVMERAMSRRDKRAVVDEFARDVDLLRSVCGEITRLGAMGSSAESAAYANLGVQMSGPSGTLIRWSVGPLQGADAARLILIGSAGKATLRMPADGGAWSFELSAPAGETRETYPDWNPASEVLAGHEDALRGRARGADWVDAARSVELADTIGRSLRRGRTIELHYEDYTEEGTFKGAMASLGCGLLLAGLGVMVAVAVLEQLGLKLIRWPKLLLGLLAIFLALQLLTLAFRRKSNSSIETDRRNSSPFGRG